VDRDQRLPARARAGVGAGIVARRAVEYADSAGDEAGARQFLKRIAQ